MKIRNILLGVILLILVSFGGCFTSGMAPVTIGINLPAELRASATSRAGVGTVPGGVFSFRLTVTGSGMATITESVAVDATSVTVNVPTGSGRTFLMEALDAGSNVVYRGTTTVDISGSELTISITMATTQSYAFWDNSWSASVTGGNVNYTASQSATPRSADKTLELIYNNNGAGGGSGVPLQTWTFSATASESGSISFHWVISGMHAWAGANVALEFFHGATTDTLIPTTTTSGTFEFRSSSAVTATLVSGETYGIRVKGANGDSNSFVSGSVIIYGQSSSLLSVGKTCTANSTEGGNLPSYAADGATTGNYWASAGAGGIFAAPEWIYIDLGSSKVITKVILYWEASATTYKLQVSNDASNWTDVGSVRNGTGNYTTETPSGILLAASYRYIRMIADGTQGTNGVSLYELEVYGY